MNRSQRPPDELHPFGHGKELYFWTLVVAVLVFAVGGGMSMYEGILHLAHPEPATHGVWTYVVLGGAAVFEGTSWVFAWRSFNRERRARGVWETVTTGKDPTAFAVLFEDSAALVGLAVAFGGVWLSATLRSPIPDAIASILIGVILMVIATLLVRATLRLLVGQSADPAMVASIRETAGGDGAVQRVGRVLTVHFGPETVLAAVELSFSPDLNAEAIATAIDRIQRALKQRCPALRHVFLEAESLADVARHAPPAR
jgi:cation diffusion facilitator family transporter